MYAHSFSKKIGFIVNDHYIIRLLKRFDLKHGVLVALLLFSAGIINLIIIYNKWILNGSYALLLTGTDILGFTLLTLGIKTFFNSFLISLINSE